MDPGCSRADAWGAHSQFRACLHVAGSLVGTHAHELLSIFAQLLAEHDDAAGGGSATPVQVGLTRHGLESDASSRFWRLQKLVLARC